MLIAREKAREAVESVHAARDTGEVAWTTIQNVADGDGVFLNGAQPIKDPGIDGLVNTADDGRRASLGRTRLRRRRSTITRQLDNTTAPTR